MFVTFGVSGRDNPKKEAEVAGSESSDTAGKARLGARNLLRNCVRLGSGHSVLLVEEAAYLDYFDHRVAPTIAREARNLGATVLTFTTPRANGPHDVPPSLTAAMMHVDHTVFLNRIGDQMRFRSLPGTCTKTMVYALDEPTLASRAAALRHEFMERMIDAFNAEMSSRSAWRITCPAGTDISGEMPETRPGQDGSGHEFAVRLFPMSVHRPVPGGSMNGRIVLQRWITGTNTNVYSPEVHFLRSPITVVVECGHAVDFLGETHAVDAFRAHSRAVGDKFGLDETLIHSWHAGLNPGTRYFARAKDDPVRWNGMIFGSPRHLHFHTCGDYPPGEINWHVIDPRVEFDGEPFLDGGHVPFFETERARLLRREFDVPAGSLVTCDDIGL